MNPYLPIIPTDPPLPITHTRAYRAACGPDFYLACLELAQSLHLHATPAQSILQINRAFMATLPADHPIVMQYPIPYRAIQWLILEHQKNPAEDASFLGNPPRHFQHLASRMNPHQPNATLRTWRAWACMHLAEAILPSDTFPRDLRQIEREKLHIPTVPETLTVLNRHTPHSDEIAQLTPLLTPRS